MQVADAEANLAKARSDMDKWMKANPCPVPQALKPLKSQGAGAGAGSSSSSSHAIDEGALKAHLDALRRKQMAARNVVHSLNERQESAKASKAQAEAALRTIDAAIQKASNIVGQRVENMRKAGSFGPARQGVELYHWICAQKAAKRFHGQVYGPLLAHIEAVNPSQAAIIEQAIPVWVRFGAVVTDSRDLRALQEWRSSDNARATGVFEMASHLVEGELNSARYKHKLDGARFAQLTSAVGPATFMDDAIVCPPEIKAVLLRECFLHDAIIMSAGDAIERFFASGLEVPLGSTLWAPDASLRFMAGAYGTGNVTSRKPNATFPALTLHLKSNESGVEAMKAKGAEAKAGWQQADAELKALEQELAVAMSDMSTAQGEVGAIQRWSEERNRLVGRLNG